MANLDEFCEKCHCMVVAPIYRTVYQGKYPAAINDVHAAYQWMVNNADELNIDVNKVAVTGLSSGGQIAGGLIFHLKRYGYKPAGAILQWPILEDRPVYFSQMLADSGWNGEWSVRSANAYLGDNAGSPFLGPEAFTNRATVEECKGLPPVFIHTSDLECQVDPRHAFAMKLHEARVFCEFHEWGGAAHGTLPMAGEDSPLGERFNKVLYGNINNCLDYDLRHDWLEQE